ncbi:hypothetical protein EOM39_02100, partial [Candidatus Gracilibacteria bacterium]|nr:hypothetical protein [Candidatus Gracilibacteria bacterium]
SITSPDVGLNTNTNGVSAVAAKIDNMNSTLASSPVGTMTPAGGIPHEGSTLGTNATLGVDDNVKQFARDIQSSPNIPGTGVVTEQTKQQLGTVTEKVVVTEKVKVDIDLSNLNFKGTRFEQREKRIKENSKNIFNDENGVVLMILIRDILKNPSTDEQLIIKGFFKDQKWIFNGDNLEEAKATGDSSVESRNIEKVYKIAQEIVKENPDITNSKIVKYVKTEKTISRYDPELAMRRLAMLNPKNMAIDTLLGDNGNRFQRRITDFFRSLSLDKILETYKRGQQSDNRDKVFDKEASEIIKGDIISSITESKRMYNGLNQDFNDPRVIALGKLLMAQRKAIAQIYFKQSMFFISNFIDDTQVGKDYFTGLKETKETERVLDLIQNKDFHHFSVLLSEELAGRRKILSNLQKKQIFASDLGLALLSLRVFDIKIATSFMTPGIKVGEGLYEKKLEYKKGEHGKSSEGLFLGGERYELQGITNVRDIVIFGNEVIIYGDRLGKKEAININKEQFINGMQELALYGKTSLESHDGSVNFGVKKIIA